MLVRWQAARLQCVLNTTEDENTDGDQDEHSWQWLCWQYHSGGDIVNIGKMATKCNVVKMDAFFAMCIVQWISWKQSTTPEAMIV